ncbi:MAG: HAD hydrolase-like protein [Saprospiraceae bacterium]|nr:HAD hydrolase-like protein [Saprospiraceae bacterium]
MTLLDGMHHIKAFIFDVDGVMTDSLVHLWENGDQTRTMNVRDGFALRRAVSNGYKIGIITGGRSKGVSARLNLLGIEDIYSGVLFKMDAYDQFVLKHKLKDKEILYMGDDLIDIPVMKRVGVAAAPRDAVVEVLEIARFVSGYDGGRGCVRDVIEKVMKIQGCWEEFNEGEKFGV